MVVSPGLQIHWKRFHCRYFTVSFAKNLDQSPFFATPLNDCFWRVQENHLLLTGKEITLKVLNIKIPTRIKQGGLEQNPLHLVPLLFLFFMVMRYVHLTMVILLQTHESWLCTFFHIIDIVFEKDSFGNSHHTARLTLVISW